MVRWRLPPFARGSSARRCFWAARRLSLLSYYRALSGRYQLLELPGRVRNRPLPEVEIVDMRQEFQAGNNGIFSGKLAQYLAECLQNKQQAMLFINRRGYFHVCLLPKLRLCRSL